MASIAAFVNVNRSGIGGPPGYFGLMPG
jgi:hypothetical protein